MIPIRSLIGLVPAVLLGLGGTGCQSGPREAPAAALAESSVHPGINQEYLNPNLEVAPWVERFEREGREIYDKRHEIVRAAQIRRGQDVADIGAGTGLFTPLLAEAVGPRGQVFAVDIVPAFLEHIRRRAAEGGWRNVRTVQCTERSVSLPRHSIDVAFLCDVYHHFEYPRSSLASIHRALRRGGTLVVVDFKRVPGQSSDWVLNHVRAGQEEVTAEIEAAGFRKLEEVRLLRDNYLLRFRKVGR